MFTAHFLNKPLTTISDIDINNFLCSINRFGTRAEVARQVLSILFGRITKDYDVLLGIVVGWLTLTRINVGINSGTTKYSFKELYLLRCTQFKLLLFCKEFSGCI